MPTLLEVPSPMPFELERQRRKLYLAAACRVFAKERFEEGLAGHVTVRDPEFPDRFWINSVGESLSKMRPSDLACVDAEGNSFTPNKPVMPSAIWSHAHIYKARPEVNSIMHMHSLYGRVFSTLGELFEPVTLESCYFYEDHSYYDSFNALALEASEGESEGYHVAKALGSNCLVIEGNHGLITVGESVGSAAWRFMVANHVCHEQILLRSLNGKYRRISPEAARQTHRQVGSEYTCWMSFEPYFKEVLADSADMA